MPLYDDGYPEPSTNSKGRPISCRYCNNQFHIQDRPVWENEKHPCPSCGEIWCDKPETERMLMILQDEYYIKNKSDKVLEQMAILLNSYCQSLLKKTFSNKIQEPGKCEYFAHMSVSFLIESYLNPEVKDFRIYGSFAGVLFRKMQQAIFGKQEYAIAEETLDFEFDDGKVFQHEDKKETIFDSLQERHSKEQLVDKICDFVFAMSEECTDEENYIRLLNLRNYVIGGERYTDKFFQLYDRTGKEKFLDTLKILRQELLKLDQEHN